MIRVDVHQRLVRTARRLHLTAEAETILQLAFFANTDSKKMQD